MTSRILPLANRGVFLPLALVFFQLLCQSGLGKDLNPFQGGFEPEEISAKQGSIVTTSLRLETLRNFEKVEISASLPEGLTLVSGERLMEIADFKPGEKKIYSYRLRVESRGEKRFLVKVKALGLSPDEAYGRGFIAFVNREKPAENSVVSTDKRGKKIRITTVPGKK